jgi:hypothetical protein
MKLVRTGSTWQIEGPGKERARLAWASMDGDRLVYSMDPGKPICVQAGPHAGASSGDTGMSAPSARVSS